MVLDPCYAPGYRNFMSAFVLLRLRVLLFGEIKRYKSPIRIRITRCKAPSPYGFRDTDWTNFLLQPAHSPIQDTMVENNTSTAHKGCGVQMLTSCK